MHVGLLASAFEIGDPSAYLSDLMHSDFAIMLTEITREKHPEHPAIRIGNLGDSKPAKWLRHQKNLNGDHL